MEEELKFKYFLVMMVLFFIMGCSSNNKSSNQNEEMTSNSIENNSNNLDLKVYKKTLNNGLKILVYEDHRLPIFSYYQFYDVGGRFESQGTTGATHFLEHMMFKGSKNYGPRSFDRIIEAAGGSNNAYTTFDNTVYYDVAPVKIFDQVLKLEADRMEHLVLDFDSFNKEKNVVFSERKMRYENRPSGLLYLAAMKTIYKGTPYGGSVIGDVKDLNNLKKENLLDFYKKFYTPDNSLIVIAGDVNHQNVFQKIEELFGKMKRSSQSTRKYKKEMNRDSRYKFSDSIPKEAHFHSTNQNPKFMLLYKGDKLGEKRSYALDILAMLGGQGDSSYLVKKLVLNKKPKFSQISISNSNKMSSGIFYFSGELMPHVSLKYAKKLLMREVNKMCNIAITDRAVQKTKNQILVDYYQSVKSNSGIARFLGNEEFYFGDFNYYKKELELYNSITTKDVKKTCNEFFSKQNKSLFVSVWNKNRMRLE